jgi:hypothetical protein
MNRIAFSIAAVLTALVLVMIGGVVGTLASAQPAAVAPAAGSPPDDPRDAEWRQLLAEANARLQQAYDAQAQPTPAPNTDIGVLGAARAALLAVPGARLLRPPELVAFEGVTAYEALLDQGTLYIDAATGQILYNGAEATQITTRGEHDDDDDHDEHDDRGHDDDHEEHEAHDDHDD